MIRITQFVMLDISIHYVPPLLRDNLLSFPSGQQTFWKADVCEIKSIADEKKVRILGPP